MPAATDRAVQQRLYPQTMPEAPALHYAGHCRPARGVGGDYYDFLALTAARCASRSAMFRAKAYLPRC